MKGVVIIMIIIIIISSMCLPIHSVIYSSIIILASCNSCSEYVASICFSPILRDISGTIGGRSGDLTHVGRVTRVWVETKCGAEDHPLGAYDQENVSDYGK